MNIAELIKTKRGELSESQEEFGKRFGLSHAAISDMERGVTKSLPTDILKFILMFEKRECPTCNGKGYLEGLKNIAV